MITITITKRRNNNNNDWIWTRSEIYNESGLFSVSGPKKDDDGGAAVDPNIGKGGKKQVDIEKTELEKTKRKARRIIRKRFVTREKYESQQDRMKKASINLNKNRFSNKFLLITLS